jgi:hypothetical protein
MGRLKMFVPKLLYNNYDNINNITMRHKIKNSTQKLIKKCKLL